MAILRQQDRDAVKSKFDLELKGDVKLTLYSKNEMGGLYIPGRDCQTCAPAQQLLEEVCELSPRLGLDVVDFYAEQQRAAEDGISRIPAIVVSSNGEKNVRFYGLPSGMEFPVLLETIVATSSKGSPLALETRRALKELEQDVHLQVFVTPN